MTFAEIGDSDNDGSDLGDVLHTGTPDQEPLYTSGIAERAKDRTRAAKQAPKASLDVLDFLSDDESFVTARNTKRPSKRVSNIIVLDGDEDDLSMSFRESGNVTRTAQTPGTVKKRRPKGKKALEIYNAPRLEDHQSSGMIKDDVSRNVFTYISDSDMVDNNLPMSSTHVDATPGLPMPISASKSQADTLPRSERPSKRSSTSNIKDSQTSPGLNGKQDSHSSSSGLQSAATTSTGSVKSISQATSDVDELAGLEPGIDIACNATTTSKFISRKKKNNPSTFVGNKKLEKVEDLTRPIPDDSLDQQHISLDARSTEKASRTPRSCKSPAKKRAKHKIPDSDESEAVLSDADADDVLDKSAIECKSRIKLHDNNVPAETRVGKIPKVEEAEDQSTDLSRILKLKVKTNRAGKAQEHVEEDRSKVQDGFIDSPALPSDNQEPEKASVIPIKIEDTKIVNYAATTGKNPAIKFTSGPRHRVGLSRRQRVEPLHANIVRK